MYICNMRTENWILACCVRFKQPLHTKEGWDFTLTTTMFITSSSRSHKYITCEMFYGIILISVIWEEVTLYGKARVHINRYKGSIYEFSRPSVQIIQSYKTTSNNYEICSAPIVLLYYIL